MAHRLRKKTLCDWSRTDIETRTALLAELTEAPRHACRKCARVAHSKKQLCKPIPLPSHSHSMML